MELTTNKQGWTVKETKPKPITDAAIRFAALLVEQEAPPGFRQPCQIFQGESFNDGQQIMKPRRFALSLRGINPPKGAKLRVLCKTPGCVRHVGME